MSYSKVFERISQKLNTKTSDRRRRNLTGKEKTGYVRSSTQDLLEKGIPRKGLVVEEKEITEVGQFLMCQSKLLEVTWTLWDPR